jgi:hypothetical protein
MLNPLLRTNENFVPVQLPNIGLTFIDAHELPAGKIHALCCQLVNGDDSQVENYSVRLSAIQLQAHEYIFVMHAPAITMDTAACRRRPYICSPFGQQHRFLSSSKIVRQRHIGEELHP